MLRPFIVKVSVLGYFPLRLLRENIKITFLPIALRIHYFILFLFTSYFDSNKLPIIIINNCM